MTNAGSASKVGSKWAKAGTVLWRWATRLYALHGKQLFKIKFNCLKIGPDFQKLVDTSIDGGCRAEERDLKVWVSWRPEGLQLLELQ